MGQLASQHIDPSRDLQHLHSWEHTEPSETSAPSTHLDPGHVVDSGHVAVAVVTLDLSLFSFLSPYMCPERLVLVFNTLGLLCKTSPPTHVHLLPAPLPASRTLPFSRQF